MTGWNEALDISRPLSTSFRKSLNGLNFSPTFSLDRENISDSLKLMVRGDSLNFQLQKFVLFDVEKLLGLLQEVDRSKSNFTSPRCEIMGLGVNA